MAAVARRLVLGGLGVLQLGLAGGRVFAQAAGGQGTLARLQAAKKVTVGIANQPPFSALDPDGSLTGVAPTITQVIMSRLGIPDVAGLIATYGQLIPGLLAGRWDFVAAALTITKPRCDQVLFSDPLVLDGDVVVSLKGTGARPPNRITDLAALNATVGVQAGGADLRVLLAAGIPLDNIRQFANDPAIIDGLLAGRVQYALMVRSPLRGLLEQRHLDLAVAYPLQDVPPTGGACAFRKQDTDLQDAFQKEFRAMKASGEWRVIATKFGFDTPAELLDVTIEQLCAT
jgi:polar amino acid transport system substrate-binding protein